MIWTVLAIAVCLALCIKLMFFTDLDRRESRWFYRLTLFFATVYAGSQVIGLLYYPTYQPSPFFVLFHLALFVGAFFVKAQHLPWNQK